MVIVGEAEWVEVDPLPGARRTWVLVSTNGEPLELEDFEEC